MFRLVLQAVYDISKEMLMERGSGHLGVLAVASDLHSSICDRNSHFHFYLYWQARVSTLPHQYVTLELMLA